MFSARCQKLSDVFETPVTRKLEHDAAVIKSFVAIPLPTVEYEMVDDEDTFTEAPWRQEQTGQTFFELEVRTTRPLQNVRHFPRNLLQHGHSMYTTDFHLEIRSAQGARTHPCHADKPSLPFCAERREMLPLLSLPLRCWAWSLPAALDCWYCEVAVLGFMTSPSSIHPALRSLWRLPTTAPPVAVINHKLHDPCCAADIHHDRC